jgi:hypothetical protein
VFTVERGAVGDELDLRVVCDVEEIGGAQMLVALLVLGVEAVGLNRQLHGWIGAQVERSLEAPEPAFDSDQPVEVTDVELDARARRVKPPGGLAYVEGVVGVVGLFCHWSSSAGSVAAGRADVQSVVRRR